MTQRQTRKTLIDSMLRQTLINLVVVTKALFSGLYSRQSSYQSTGRAANFRDKWKNRGAFAAARNVPGWAGT